ncbi:MAG: hypothetical protein DRJ09_08580 [Bacteroidetes bacterium]|nr:MAG: hypothetical protein DRJ09_08580 [Bacteroidota bacterium]
MNLSQNQIRLLGIAGIMGGLVLFAGDMLYYYDGNSINLKLNMGHATDFRIIASGATALIATWLYLLGLGQVYFAFKPAKSRTRNLVVLSFAAILTAYGIVHGAYVAIAVSAKLAVQHKLDLETTTELASSANNLLRLFVYPAFAVFSYFFIVAVWKKKTYYPRWILPFFPLVPFLFRQLITGFFSGGMWVIVSGGFLNLILVLFFTASTVALWKVKRIQQPGFK